MLSILLETWNATPIYISPWFFRSQEFNDTSFDEWVDAAKAPALPSSLKLYNELQGLGFHVILLTGRAEFQRNSTEANLLFAGYQAWEKLILRYFFTTLVSAVLAVGDLEYILGCWRSFMRSSTCRMANLRNSSDRLQSFPARKWENFFIRADARFTWNIRPSDDWVLHCRLLAVSLKDSHISNLSVTPMLCYLSAHNCAVVLVRSTTIKILSFKCPFCHFNNSYFWHSIWRSVV